MIVCDGQSFAQLLCDFKRLASRDKYYTYLPICAGFYQDLCGIPTEEDSGEELSPLVLFDRLPSV